MKRVTETLRWVLCGLWLTMISCVGGAPTGEVQLVDSLNRVAYDTRYKDLEASCRAAEEAFQAAGSYRQGRAEAFNHLAFCSFMRMDFEESERLCKEVFRLTKNELELLVADVGMMKICQRTSLNKEFYDYRNSALRRLSRIAEESELFPAGRGRDRLRYARSEFFIVSAIYYYYLKQRTEAMECMAQAGASEEMPADTNQLLYYHYIKGGAALCEGTTAEERRLREFDQLYQTWRLASEKGYLYFEGNSLQSLADLLQSLADLEYFRNRRSFALTQLDETVDDELPLRLGQRALEKFRRYNDPYQIASAYLSIGKYLNTRGQYAEALDTLARALSFVDISESVSRIHEQLSVAYAGLGEKDKSDENRNMYLDILEETRQDKELESRYQALEEENRQLNVLLGMVAVGFVALLLFFAWVNRRSRKKNRQHLQRLQLLLELCRKITVSIPADAESEEEMENALYRNIEADLEKLFGRKDIQIANGQLHFPYRPSRESQAMARVINPYIRWAMDNSLTSLTLSDERRRLEKQRYIHEQHIVTNKRQNLLKRTCLSIVTGIQPFIDRIINEVRKLTEKTGTADADMKAERYQYIDELVGTINEYNDILALWIKMKQGTLSLNIETFPLNELFDLIRKGSRAFDQKQQSLMVEETDATVKADKALTLFMINTLAENARKYTPCGGEVKIYAQRAEDYVEISVADNGCGLSAEDVACIVGEKVYDSRTIGTATAADPEALRKNKGSGFGLMNCRGIIEKYRKTSPLFRVCLFSVESEVGQGSRFYFRLPVGVRKSLVALCCLFTFSALFSCNQRTENLETVRSLETPVSASDSLLQSRVDSETMLDIASDFANDAYFCNVEGDYDLALQCVDSAIIYLNAYCEQYASEPLRPMRFLEEEQPAELEWWESSFDTDFHVILDIRNEAAVASLALNDWEAYTYNNDAYTALFKLLGEDRSLEEYCLRLKQSTNNKLVGILIALLLLAALPVGYYLLYLRRRLQNRWNLEQVLEVNHAIFAASQLPGADDEEALLREEETLRFIPRQIVNAVFDRVDELIGTDCLTLAVFNESTGRLEYASHTSKAENDEKASADVRSLMERCFSEHRTLAQGEAEAFPLLVEAGSESRCVGVLCLERSEPLSENARLLVELMARYVSIVIFNAVVKLANKYRDIETAHDEARRASHEENQLHVQNQVLDNCLSTIKHETIYYPNRIKQLIARLRSATLPPMEEGETVQAIGELIAYYKGIYTLLSRCASRQLEEVTFRRVRVSVPELLAGAEKYLRKASRAGRPALTLVVSSVEASVLGDAYLLRFLFENLLDEALAAPGDGELTLTAERAEGFICFRFTDRRRTLSSDELHRLFYPDLARMTATARGGELSGTEFLVCKQIVRDHDEFAGRRGCRINAEQTEGGGFTIYFTLPEAARSR